MEIRTRAETSFQVINIDNIVYFHHEHPNSTGNIGQIYNKIITYVGLIKK